MQENLQELQAESPAVQQQLRDLVQGTFPQEALEEMKRILAGNSEYAMIIHNAPERSQLQKRKTRIRPEETYSYHIGNALYELCGAKPVRALELERASHVRYAYIPHAEGNIHRDMAGPVAPTLSLPRHGEILMLASPYNGERAPTEVIRLQHAIEEIPEDDRSRIRVNAVVRTGTEMVHVEERSESLAQILDRIRNNRCREDGDLKGLAITARNQPEQDPQLVAALERNSQKIVLNPGDLLVFNERNIFHRAHGGDEAAIAAIPANNHKSRILVHVAGGMIR